MTNFDWFLVVAWIGWPLWRISVDMSALRRLAERNRR
ncbi:hypothetical protein V473_02625 [Sphingobium cupriresistens LL01]|uniref:Uncharacterized protein n=1 Tax=Sphingobium cupriresistens LL01 TaxID=1420583 RepID=A0A0J7Y4B9_9SPHN|nr:hypothetical protein V473_02625 [Sphingobium cupriresistens LL01]